MIATLATFGLARQHIVLAIARDRRVNPFCCGGAQASVTPGDGLEPALEAIAAGRPVKPATAKPIGCDIEDPQ